MPPAPAARRPSGTRCSDASVERSAGLVVEAFRQRAVGIDATIAQKWPVRAAEFDLGEIAIDDHHLFLVDRRALDDLAVGRCDERLAPEDDAVLVDRLALRTLDDLV